MGVDLKALDQQVEEKRRIKEYQAEQDGAYAAQMVQLDQHLCRMDHEIAGIRHQRAKDTNAYRTGYQRRDQTREWDLNDPKRVNEETVDRAGPMGVSSIQVFEGEDTLAKETKKAMKGQFRVWTQQQVDEKDLRTWAQREDDRAYGERQEEMTVKAHEIAKALEGERKRIAVDTAYFNKALSEQKKMEGHLNKFREQQANIAEIQQALDSDLLTEALASTVNANDPSRYKNDHMKGLLPEQRQAIMDGQEQQRRYNAEQRLLQSKQDRTSEIMESKQRRTALMLDRQQQRDKREEMRQLTQDRRQQAYEAAERNQTLNKLYSNDVGEDFQGRFGASLR